MGDVGEYWRDHRDYVKKKKEDRLAKADPTGWSFHTEYHWYRFINDKKLDYWPSTGKWQYEGKVYHKGSVESFIKNLGKEKDVEVSLIDIAILDSDDGECPF